MEQLFSDMQERLETLYKAIETAVADLPAEALDWKPATDETKTTQPCRRASIPGKKAAVQRKLLRILVFIIQS